MNTDAAADIAGAQRRKHSDRSGRPQSAEIDQTILKATLDVLADVGFDALSLAEVSRRSGSSIPAIYRRHADKLQLVLAALKSELAELPVGVADTGNLRDDLVDLAQRIATALTTRRARLFAGIVLAGRDTPELLEVLASELHREAVNEAAASSIIGDLPGAYLLGKTLLDGRSPDMRHLEAMIDKVILPALLSSQDRTDHC
jgi:AcrR family transcriptional regulator